MNHEDFSGIALFNGLSEAEIEACAEHFDEVEVLTGTELTHQDDFGYAFFVVLEGHVEVVVDHDVVASLGPGDYFGEMALVFDHKRNATVKASERSRLAKMMNWDFQELIEKNAILAQRVEAVAHERAHE